MTKVTSIRAAEIADTNEAANNSAVQPSENTLQSPDRHQYDWKSYISQQRQPTHMVHLLQPQTLTPPKHRKAGYSFLRLIFSFILRAL